MDYKVNIVQEIYHKFEEWLDSLLDNNDMPEDTAAYNFNLYDEAMEGIVYGIQIVACDNQPCPVAEAMLDWIRAGSRRIFSRQEAGPGARTTRLQAVREAFAGGQRRNDG